MSAAAIAVALLVGALVPIAPEAAETGIATYYTYEEYGGGPLYAHRTLHYDYSHDLPWCAVNVEAYLSGAVLPGDKLVVEFLEYDVVLYLEAWDAGPFTGYYIEDFGPDMPIIVDIPEHLWPLDVMSARVRVTNISAVQRALS